MERYLVRSKRVLGGLVLLVILAGGGVAWKERTRICAWYYLSRLAGAGASDREHWARRVAGLEDNAVPGLLGCLRREDARSCNNAGTALACLAAHWESRDRRSSALAERLAVEFPTFSAAGQQETLEFLTGFVQLAPGATASPADLVLAVAHTLGKAAAAADPVVRTRALDLAGRLLAAELPAEAEGPCRDVVNACLRHPEPGTRVQAVRLASRPDLSLREVVVPLLNDKFPEVRQAALLAVGNAPEVLDTDDLLYWLHDPDAEVRRLCVQALQGRGLTAAQLKLGRLMTDARPEVRLQVLEFLEPTADLAPGVWLRRLSHDPAPAVRAAALRALAEQPQLGLRDRLEQMAQNDPSPTVQQLASHYLRQKSPSTGTLTR